MRFIRDRYEKHRKDLEKLVRFRTGPKLKSTSVCDFCGSDDIEWVYAATRMSTGVSIQNWRWCACELCADAIESDDRQTLEDRVLTRLQEIAPGLTQAQAIMRTAVKMVLLEFYAYAATE